MQRAHIDKTARTAGHRIKIKRTRTGESRNEECNSRTTPCPLPFSEPASFTDSLFPALSTRARHASQKKHRQEIRISCAPAAPYPLHLNWLLAPPAHSRRSISKKILICKTVKLCILPQITDSAIFIHRRTIHSFTVLHPGTEKVSAAAMMRAPPASDREPPSAAAKATASPVG